jgi:hypothetical protein
MVTYIMPENTAAVVIHNNNAIQRHVMFITPHSLVYWSTTHSTVVWVMLSMSQHLASATVTLATVGLTQDNNVWPPDTPGVLTELLHVLLPSYAGNTLAVLVS